jgi:hypothetical protein
MNRRDGRSESVDCSNYTQVSDAGRDDLEDFAMSD